MSKNAATIAIVDFGMGNLFSVKNALAHFDIPSVITQNPRDVEQAAGVILPGVGAFANAMASLAANKLIAPLQRVAADGRPLFGICLGMQLLMERSFEFGEHRGLGIIPGEVRQLIPHGNNKVPNIGWSPLHPAKTATAWTTSPFRDLTPATMMYFVHSYHVVLKDDATALAFADFGTHPFVAALKKDSVVACQFHPERSGPAGLTILKNFAKPLTAC